MKSCTSLTCFAFRFTPNWLMTVITVVFIALFMRLGSWQLQRADEKRKMVVTEAIQAKQQPLAWNPQQANPLQYQKVQVQGHYLDRIFLFDNQHYQHEFGYDALSPISLVDGTVVMVDRGWIKGDSTRQTFPDVSIPKGLVTVQGSAYFPSTNQWLLGPDSEEKENKIIILERLDTKLMSEILQKSVHPFIIRLDKQDAYGFVREWAIVSMPPERHLGYALQWFAMAIVILIIFVALNLKKKDEKKRI